MKDEEMAEEWWNNWVVKDWNDIKEGKRLFIQAFLAGLKAGRPQWHDLRIDPNDLPEKEGKNKFESKLVYISYPDGDTDFAYYEFPHKEWYRLFNDEPTISPIAWCEVPTFDKE